MDPKHVIRRVKLTEMLSWERLFIPSRLSTRRSTKSSAEVNPQGRSTEKVKTVAERQPPRASGRETATSSRG
jgi:hypothetical protein